MGGSSLANAEDSSAMFINPAGASGLHSLDLYVVHSQLYAGMAGVGGIKEGLITFGVPSRFGAFGVGFATFRASGLLQERTIALSWARKFGRFDVGAVGKHLFHGYEVNGDPLAAQDPVFSGGTSRSAFALDLGVMAQVRGPIKAGLAVRNLNQPDVGLATEDLVEREIQGGLVYENQKRAFRVTGDVLYRENGFSDGRKALPSIGFEKSLHNRKVLFRVGANPLEYAGGFGLRFGRVGFDYALILRKHLLEGNAGTHSFGVRLQFGGPGERNRAELADDPDTDAVPLEGQ